MPIEGRRSPNRLTPERHRRIVDALATGSTFAVAAQHGQVGMNSLRRWLDRGRAADLLLRDTIDALPEHVREELAALSDVRPPVRPDVPLPASPYEVAMLAYIVEPDRTSWRLWKDTEMAVASFEVTNLALIEEAGRGYDAPETITTDKFDKDGRLIERTVVVREKRLRYWNALAWLLERRFPERYARHTTTELTGPGGQPLQIEGVTAEDAKLRAVQLVDEVASIREKRAARADSNGHGDVTGTDA